MSEKKMSGILDRINASQEQKDELHRLYEEDEKMMRQGYSDMGKIVLKILSPEQQEKLIEALDPRNDSPDAAESKSMTKTGAARLVVSGDGVPADAATTSGQTGSLTKVDKGTVTLSKPPADQQAKQSAPDGGVTADFVPFDESEFINMPAYHLLCTGDSRKEFKISSKQETKLREIDRNFHSDMQKINVNYWKMSPQEQKAKEGELTKSIQQLKKAARKQIEDVLTADQLAALKNATLHDMATAIMATPIGEKIGLSAEQKKQLNRLQDEMHAKMNRTFRTDRDKSLAVLSDQQREKLIAKFAQVDIAGPEISINSGDYYGTTVLWTPANEVEKPYKFSFSSSIGSFSVYPWLEEEDNRKEIGLFTEQQTKLQALSAKYQPELKNLFESFDKIQELSTDEQKTKQAELRRKLEEMGKAIRRQIEEVLTPGQLTALKDTVSRFRAFSALTIPDPGIYAYVNVGQEQQDKLRQIRDDRSKLFPQIISETGDKSLKVLTPQQIEMMKQEIDKIDNQNW